MEKSGVIPYPKSKNPLPKTAQKVFTGEIFTVWQWEQELYDGSIKIFEKLSRSATVGVLPITTDNKIITTHQEQPNMQPFISLAGGVVDTGEAVVTAAHRELLEETGYQTDDLQLWYSTQPVGKIEWPVYLFVARSCRKVAELSPDAGEKITTELVDWEAFLELLYLDNFRDVELAFHILKQIRTPEGKAKLEQFLFGSVISF